MRGHDAQERGDRQMRTAGAFVDLGRVADTVAAVAVQSRQELGSGMLGNVPRALQHERSALHAVVEQARTDPGAFAGAPDVLDGVRLLDGALDDLATSIEAIHGATAAPGARRGLRPAEVPIAGGSEVVGDRLAAAERSIREGFERLGGRRELPAYEPGPAADRTMLEFADPDSAAVRAPRHRAAQAMARSALHGGIGRALGVHTIDASTLPTTGAAILAPNHASMLDPLHALAAIDRPVRPMAKAGLFQSALLGPVLRTAGAYPVEHGASGPALSNARTILAQGEALLVYPAGKIHHTNANGAHGRGVAQLATELGAPVTPVGTWGAAPRSVRTGGPAGSTFVPRRPVVSVAFGTPIAPPAADTPFNRAIFHERIARAQGEAIDRARADYASRVEAIDRRRPLVRAAVAATGTGLAAATALSVASD